MAILVRLHQRNCICNVVFETDIVNKRRHKDKKKKIIIDNVDIDCTHSFLCTYLPRCQIDCCNSLRNANTLIAFSICSLSTDRQI